MIQIPKFIKDTLKYFQYEGSPNPTTQDDLQAFMKSDHSVLECLVDGLWQPETYYKENHIVRSPNMQAGFVAKVTKAGTSGSNEPDWGGATASDGTIEWKVQKQGSGSGGGASWEASTFYNIDSTVSLEGKSSFFLLCVKSGTSGATEPTVDGENNVTDGSVTWKPVYYKKLPVLDNSNYVKGENLAGYWKASELVQIGTVRYLQGDKYAGYFLKCTQAGTTGTTQPSPATTSTTAFADGGAKWELKQIPDKKEVMDSIPNISEYPSWYFDRGDGSDGAFNPSGATTISDVKNYTSVNIPSNVTVTVKNGTLIKCQGSFINKGKIVCQTANKNTEGLFAGGAGGNSGHSEAGTAGAGVVNLVLNKFGEIPIVFDKRYGGGSGGTGGTTPSSVGGGAGGTGGAGGGILRIVTNSLNNTGSITANGAVGSKGGDGSSSWNISGGGGGGGGGGGAIIIICNDLISQGTVTANGGTGGAGGSRAGKQGATGSKGLVYIKELGV